MTMKRMYLAVISLALVLTACGGAGTGTGRPGLALREGEGVVELPLLSTGSGGQSFRLVGATFDIKGLENQSITDTTADTLTVQLPAGGYTVELKGDYHLERLTPGAPAETIPATLISPNPLPFTVAEGEARTVRFLFKTPADGTTDIGFSVDTGGWITGTLDFAPTQDPSIPPDLAELVGKSVPFAVSFDSATLTRNTGFNPALVATAQSVSVQFGGPFSVLLNERIAPALSRGFLTLDLAVDTSTANLYIREFFVDGLSPHGGAGDLYMLRTGASTSFRGTIDGEGVPTPQDLPALILPFSLGHPSNGRLIQGTMRATGSMQ